MTAISVRLCREESQRVVDVILSRREDFGVFDTYISEYDRSMSLLEESCRSNPAFAGIVKKFEVNDWERQTQPRGDKTLNPYLQECVYYCVTVASMC